MPLLALGICSALYLLSLGHFLSRHLAPIVVSAVESTIKREVRVRQVVAFNQPGRVDLYGVAVSNAPTFAQDRARAVAAHDPVSGLPALVADRVTITYNWRSLLFDPGNAAASLEDITVDKPTAFIERLTQAKFNFTSLFQQKPNPKAKPFKGQILIQNGAAYFLDDTAPKALQPAINSFHDLAGVVNFHSDNVIYYAVHGIGEPAHIATIGVSGDVLRNDTPQSRANGDQGYRLRLQAQGANALYLASYFLSNTKKVGQIVSGTAGADVTISQIGKPHHAPLDLTGSLNVAGGKIVVTDRRLVAKPIENIHGRFFFTGDGVTVDTTGTLQNMPLAVSGAVFDFHQPNLALLLHSSNVNVATLRGALPFVPALPGGVSVVGRGAVDLSVSGTATQPVIQGRASLPEADIAGNRLVNLQGQATFAQGLLTMKTLTAQALAGGGSIEAHGVVDTQGKQVTFLFAGTGRGVNLAALHIPAAAAASMGPVTGIGDASFFATNRGANGSAKPVSVAANFSVLNASFRRVPFAQISGRALWQEGTGVALRDFFLREKNGGIMLANGAIPTGRRGRWDLTVQTARINLGQLATALHMGQIGGVAYFNGHVTGPSSEPQIAGRTTVFSPRYGVYAGDTLEAQVAATPHGVRIVHAVINRFPATASITGTVTDLETNPRLALDIDVTHGDLSDIVQMATSTPRGARATKAVASTLPSITGEASAKINVTGTLQALRMAGTASVTGATIGAYRVDSANADLSYEAGTVRVDSLTVQGEGATVKGSGEYGVDRQRVAAKFHGDNLDIARLASAFSPGVQATGTLSFDGQVAGTIKKPVVTVNAAAQNLLVEGVPFSHAETSGRYENGVIDNNGAPTTLVSQGTTYRVSSFSYQQDTKHLSLAANVENESLPHLVGILNSEQIVTTPFGQRAHAALAYLPQPLAGTLDISTLSLHGPLSNLAGNLVAKADGLKIGTIGLDSIQTDLSYGNHTVNINQFVGRGETAYATASGTVDLQGPIDAHFEASNISLAAFNFYLPAGSKLSGEVSDFTCEASGETRAPDLVASLTLEHPGYNSFSVDHVDSGRITLANGEITIDRLSLAKNETLSGGRVVDHVAVLNGSIPFKWLPDGFLTGEIPTDAPLALHADIPQQSLSVLSLFAPSLSASAVTGQIAAHVDLGGTIAHKTASGALTLQDGAVHLPGITTQLSKINGAVSFTGNKATISQFSAESSAGGSISVAGTGTFGANGADDTASLAEELLGGIDLNLSADAKNFTVNEPKLTALYNAGFRGKMNGSLHITQSLLRPHIAGSMNVAEALGSLPNEQAAEGPATKFLVDPSFDISVAIAKGASLRSAQLNAQGDGTMTIQGRLSHPDVIGHFLVRQGRFSFPTAVFNIVPVGKVDFYYNPPDEVAEQVYIEATTSVDIGAATLASNTPITGVQMPASFSSSGFSGLPAGGGHYQIRVTIQGLLNVPDQLRLDFQSDPPGLSQDQILAALGGQQALNNLAGGNVQLALQQEVSQIFTSYAVPTLLSPVETGIAEAFGLESFGIDYSPLVPVQVTLVKKVGPREEATYTQSLTSRQPGAATSTVRPPQYQLKLEYNFTDRLGLYASTDDQHNNTLGVQGVFEFW